MMVIPTILKVCTKEDTVESLNVDRRPKVERRQK